MMHHTITYHSLETRYELEVDQEDDCLITPPSVIAEQPDGSINASDGMAFDGLIEMTHHYRCEIVSLESEPGN